MRPPSLINCAFATCNRLLCCILGSASEAGSSHTPRLEPSRATRPFRSSVRLCNVRKSCIALSARHKGAVRAISARRPPPPPPRAKVHMGQSTSTEARLEEIRHRLLPAARQRVQDLGPAAAAETAGTPPAHGSKHALHQAAIQHLLQLHEECRALSDRWSECYR